MPEQHNNIQHGCAFCGGGVMWREFPTCVAQAADGPAPTLVVDMRDQGPYCMGCSREQLKACRVTEMARDSRLGAKTIGILECSASTVQLLFIQGLGDEIDPLSETCLNSAVAAVAVAREKWGLTPADPVLVRFGSVTFEISEAAA